jgi:coenzyme F420-dependent glucose-6-phosphate dehydrogenase
MEPTPRTERVRLGLAGSGHAGHLRPEDLDASVRISADLQRHLAWLQQDVALGVSQITLHKVNREQEAIIDVVGARVLPALQKT